MAADAAKPWQYCAWAAEITRRIARRSGASTGCSGLCPLPLITVIYRYFPFNIARDRRCAPYDVISYADIRICRPFRADRWRGALPGLFSQNFIYFFIAYGVMGIVPHIGYTGNSLFFIICAMVERRKNMGGVGIVKPY